MGQSIDCAIYDKNILRKSSWYGMHIKAEIARKNGRFCIFLFLILTGMVISYASFSSESTAATGNPITMLFNLRSGIRKK